MITQRGCTAGGGGEPTTSAAAWASLLTKCESAMKLPLSLMSYFCGEQNVPLIPGAVNRDNQRSAVVSREGYFSVGFDASSQVIVVRSPRLHEKCGCTSNRLGRKEFFYSISAIQASE